jgi:hypothetical protein
MSRREIRNLGASFFVGRASEPHRILVHYTPSHSLNPRQTVDTSVQNRSESQAKMRRHLRRQRRQFRD